MEEKRSMGKTQIRIIFVLAFAWLVILPNHSGCGQEVEDWLAKLTPVPGPEMPELKIHSDLRPFVPRNAKPAVPAAKEEKTRKRTGNRERIYNDIIVRAADRHKIDPAMIKAIIKAESGYNPAAVSKKGAMGLMQLMPETAEAMGVENGFDPEHNINGGVKYFRKLLDRFDGEVELALAAYQAGAGKVRKYNGIPPFRSTQIYIQKVFKYYRQYKTLMEEQIDRV